jgi:hypothetical protein
MLHRFFRSSACAPDPRLEFALTMKRKQLFATFVAAALLLGSPIIAFAGSPHFVGSGTAVLNGDGSLTVTAKEAGLGDESQIQSRVTATAECINGGGKHPKAVNKEGVSGNVATPVQNGKADISVTLQAPTFSPPCDPPMTVHYTDIVVFDDTNGLSVHISGTF